MALYALVAPVLTLGAGSVLAAGQDGDQQKESSQYEQSAGQSDSKMKSDGKMHSDSNKAMRDQSGMKNQDYIASTPANGMRASGLIGAEITTTGDENVGEVSDLIIDQNGQVVAVVVGVGGFLGMGEKDVAISWDQLTASGTSDGQKLRVNVTRDELQSAPKFEKQN